MKFAVLTILLSFLVMSVQGMEKPRESLHWAIESFLSGFFSQKIYKLFQKHVYKEDYTVQEEELAQDLQNEFDKMTKFGSVQVRKVRALIISPNEEKNQADWAVFEVDIKHEETIYYYAILTFKGTACMKDLFADADQNLVTDDFLETLVPRGFHDSLNPVKNKHFAVVPLEKEIFCHVYQKEDEDSEERNILVTGHSLGGALAKLIGARIKSPFFSATLESIGYGYLLPLIEQARIYTFGAPQLFQKDYIDKIKNEDFSDNFIHFQIDSDPVPKLQLFKDYRKMYGTVCNKFSYFTSMIFGSKDEPVETFKEVEFGDFGQTTILASYDSENCTSLSYKTDMVGEAIKYMREKGEKMGAVKTLLQLPNHAIDGYFNELKNQIQHENIYCKK